MLMVVPTEWNSQPLDAMQSTDILLGKPFCHGRRRAAESTLGRVPTAKGRAMGLCRTDNAKMSRLHLSQFTARQQGE